MRSLWAIHITVDTVPRVIYLRKSHKNSSPVPRKKKKGLVTNRWLDTIPTGHIGTQVSMTNQQKKRKIKNFKQTFTQLYFNFIIFWWIHMDQSLLIIMWQMARPHYIIPLYYNFVVYFF